MAASTRADAVPLQLFHPRTGWTLTTHYWTAALAGSVLLSLLFLPIYLVEDRFFHLQGTPWRMVWNPFEFATRVVGLSHFVIAVLFQMRRLPLQRATTWLWVVAMVALGALGSVAFAAAGATANPLAVILFYFVFLMHSSRDDVLFYGYYGGSATTPAATANQDTRWLHLATTGMFALLIPAAILVVRLTGEGRLPGWLSALRVHLKPKEVAALATVLPASWPLSPIVILAALPGISLLTVGLLRLRGAAGGLRGVWARHASLVKVFGLTLAVVYLSVLNGAGTLYLIVLIHFLQWFQFTMMKLRRAPAATRRPITARMPASWLVNTPGGFAVLHIGLSAMFLTLIAFDHYVLGQARLSWGTVSVPNPITLFFSSSVFYYWTIVHVTLSFIPKPKPALS